MGLLSKLFGKLFGKKEDAAAVSARELDKAREAEEQKQSKKKKAKQKRTFKKTVIDTMPYEGFVSNHVLYDAR